MRVLFVDDEPRVLEGIENLLFDAADDWDLLFATSGEEALAILDAGPVDVLVTDMRMPSMSGEELLERVRIDHPSVVRIVLSGQTDRAVAERCLQMVHDFLSKPCSVDELVSTVVSARAVAKSADTASLRRLLGRLPGLPTAPGLYTRVEELIATGADQSRIVEVLSADIAITVQLIHIANSGFYGFRTAASSLAEAVPRLGLSAVSAVVLAAESARSFDLGDSNEVLALNAHAGEVAGLLRAAGGGGPGEALTAMVHDIGQMILLVSCGAELAEIDQRCQAEPARRSEIEREVLGFDHGSAGGYLLRLWKIDPMVSRAVEFHHAPWTLAEDDPARPLAARVSAADMALTGGRCPAEAPPWFVELVERFGDVLAGVGDRG